MALDAALLECQGPPTLRFYGWQPHAVSLGYFQRFDDFRDVAATSTPIVRRSTGGGAIHHGHELTFSLAVDAALLPAEVADSYALLHDGLVDALATIGVRCQRAGGDAMPTARARHRWCFEEPVRDDLVTDRGKLCGSAQRRVRRPRPRVLHHGSLVLERPALTPFVAAVADQVAVNETLTARLCRAIRDEIGDRLGLGPTAGTFDADERTMAATLAARRYAEPTFVRRR